MTLETLKNKSFSILISSIKYIAIFIFSYLFLLVFSLWTTPLYKNWYGCDASFFTMAGRGITKGWVPYKDFFDLKGPYFFFIEALGQFIKYGRTGAFILQIVAMFFSMTLVMKLSRLFVSWKKTFVVLFVFAFWHIATLWGGNTLEEFALPLNLITLYLTTKDYLKNKEYKPSTITAIVTGISFGIILFSKVTVAAPIIGIVLASIIIFIKNKDFKGLFFYLLYSFLGILIAVTPIFIYFGLHNSISDMIYSVFIFAFKRSIDYGTKFNLRWELKISGCYFAMIYALCQLICFRLKKKGSEDSENQLPDRSYSCPHLELHLIILCMSIISALLFHLGDPFIYYFTTAFPSVLFSLILLFYINEPLIIFKSWRVDVPLIALLIPICYFASCSANTLSTVIYDRNNGYYENYYNQAKEMASLIPDRERDEVYSFNIDMQWFEINRILPCHQYQVNLQFFCALDPAIEAEILKYLKETPPKWLVIGGDLSTYLPNINESVCRQYENIYSNDYGALYLLQ